MLVMFVSVTVFANGYPSDDPRHGRKGPFTIGMNRSHQVALMDRDGFTVKIYPSATHNKNIEIYPSGECFYVLRGAGRSSYQVNVFDIKTGQNLRIYPVSQRDIKSNRWVR
jgi:hypothetical protein